MSEPSSPPGKLRFGEFTLDVASAELWRGGVVQPLQEHAFQVLALLTDHPGELITRERLIARLWPRTTYIDTDAGLNTAVKRLRTVLGDDADQPRYIETLPRRGYRFIARVELADIAQGSTSTVALAGPSGEAPAPATDQLMRGSWRSSRRVIFGLLVLLAITAIATITVKSREYWQGVRAPKPIVYNVSDNVSIAVLPFLNLTGDPQREYLALGVSDTVLNQLAELRGVDVIARTSSFAFRGRSEDVRDIGRRLNASYLLEGSLQDSATRLRITTQLIDAKTGVHIWSKSFDRKLEDIFAVQDEIAREVTRALQTKVKGLNIDLPRRLGTENLDAWLAYQQGRALTSSRRVESLREALTSLERAVHLDPTFAAAYVELANAHLLLSKYGTPVSSNVASRQSAHQVAPSVERALAQALALDPANGEAWIMRGALEGDLRDDFEKGEADIRRGLSLNPSSAAGYQKLAEFISDEPDRQEEALALLARARQLDPLEPRGAYYAGTIHMLRGDTAQAERFLLEALQIRPDYGPALTRMGMVSWGMRGQFADAIKYGEHALAIDPQSSWARGVLVIWYLELDEVSAAESRLSADPSTDPGTMQIDFYRGGVAGTAEFLYKIPENFDICDTALDGYILLEHARATGDYKRASRFLLERVSAGPSAEEHAPLWDRTGHLHLKEGQEHVAIVIAQLLKASGDSARARQLLSAVLSSLDRWDGPSTPDGCVAVNHARARAFAILGQGPQAIQALTRATKRDSYWYFGWYLFDRDPAYTQLRSDPTFQSLREAYRARVLAEQAKLRELRAAGLITSMPALANTPSRTN